MMMTTAATTTNEPDTEQPLVERLDAADDEPGQAHDDEGDNRLGNCAMVATPLFQRLMGLLILAQAFLQSVDDKNETTIELVNGIFLVVFTMEIGLQAVHRWWFCFRGGAEAEPRLMLLESTTTSQMPSAWFVTDGLLVVFSWLFLIVATDFLVLTTSLRLIPRNTILRRPIQALLTTLPSLATWGSLLLLDFFMFAVLFTKRFGSIESFQFDYFSRLDNSLFTLYQLMTLDGWAEICRNVMTYEPGAWMPFVAFLSITAVLVVNIFATILYGIGMNFKQQSAEQQSDNTGGLADSNSNNDNNNEGEERARLEKKVDELTQMVQHLLSLQQQQQS